MTDFRALCVELTDCLEKADWPNQYKIVFQQWIDIAHAALAESDGPAVSDDGKSDSVTHQIHRRATILLVRKAINQAIRDADTGEQLVHASDLLAWAEHIEQQMEQLID